MLFGSCHVFFCGRIVDIVNSLFVYLFVHVCNFTSKMSFVMYVCPVECENFPPYVVYSVFLFSIFLDYTKIYFALYLFFCFTFFFLILLFTIFIVLFIFYFFFYLLSMIIRSKHYYSLILLLNLSLCTNSYVNLFITTSTTMLSYICFLCFFFFLFFC